MDKKTKKELEALQKEREEVFKDLEVSLRSDSRFSPDQLASFIDDPSSAYVKLHKAMDMLENYVQEVGSKPDVIEELLDLGLPYGQKRYNAYAIERYSEELEKNPDDVILLYYRGMTYMNMQKLEDARADFDRALENDPGNVVVVSARALIPLYQLGIDKEGYEDDVEEETETRERMRRREKNNNDKK